MVSSIVFISSFPPIYLEDINEYLRKCKTNIWVQIVSIQRHGEMEAGAQVWGSNRFADVGRISQCRSERSRVKPHLGEGIFQIIRTNMSQGRKQSQVEQADAGGEHWETTRRGFEETGISTHGRFGRMIHFGWDRKGEPKIRETLSSSEAGSKLGPARWLSSSHSSKLQKLSDQFPLDQLNIQKPRLWPCC